MTEMCCFGMKTGGLDIFISAVPMTEMCCFGMKTGGLDIECS